MITPLKNYPVVNVVNEARDLVDYGVAVDKNGKVEIRIFKLNNQKEVQ